MLKKFPDIERQADSAAGVRGVYDVSLFYSPLSICILASLTLINLSDCVSPAIYAI